MIRHRLVPLVALIPAFAQADTCDTLRDQVDARIRASGVSRFTVSVVDAGAATAGKVVGTCNIGKRKLVYLRTDTATDLSQAPAPRPGRSLPMITECKDGSEPRNGVCK